MKRTLVLIVSVALLGLVGCASDSGDKGQTEKKTEAKKDERPWDQRLTVGMSKDDVKTALGNPRNTMVNSDGTEMWTFDDREKGFIPFYSVSGGKFQHLVVTFDKDSKVKSWSSSTSGGY